MYIQPDVIYSHLLIDQPNGIEPCIHLGLDDIDIVKRSYIEGETSEQIYTWHSDEKMKRIEAQRDALLEQRDELRRALEIIAVGDATNPQAQAAEELIALGYWRDIPEARAASRSVTS